MAPGASHGRGSAALALCAHVLDGRASPRRGRWRVVLVSGPGWRRALRALAVPACAYLVWFAQSGRKGLGDTGDYFNASVFLKVPEFVLPT